MSLITNDWGKQNLEISVCIGQGLALALSLNTAWRFEWTITKHLVIVITYHHLRDGRKHHTWTVPRIPLYCAKLAFLDSWRLSLMCSWSFSRISLCCPKFSSFIPKARAISQSSSHSPTLSPAGICRDPEPVALKWEKKIIKKQSRLINCNYQ